MTSVICASNHRRSQKRREIFFPQAHGAAEADGGKTTGGDQAADGAGRDGEIGRGLGNAQEAAGGGRGRRRSNIRRG